MGVNFRVIVLGIPEDNLLAPALGQFKSIQISVKSA